LKLTNFEIVPSALLVKFFEQPGNSPLEAGAPLARLARVKLVSLPFDGAECPRQLHGKPSANHVRFGYCRGKSRVLAAPLQRTRAHATRAGCQVVAAHRPGCRKQSCLLLGRWSLSPRVAMTVARRSTCAKPRSSSSTMCRTCTHACCSSRSAVSTARQCTGVRGSESYRSACGRRYRSTTRYGGNSRA